MSLQGVAEIPGLADSGAGEELTEGRSGSLKRSLLRLIFPYPPRNPEKSMHTN